MSDAPCTQGIQRPSPFWAVGAERDIRKGDSAEELTQSTVVSLREQVQTRKT